MEPVAVSKIYFNKKVFYFCLTLIILQCVSFVYVSVTCSSFGCVLLSLINPFTILTYSFGSFISVYVPQSILTYYVVELLTVVLLIWLSKLIAKNYYKTWVKMV